MSITVEEAMNIGGLARCRIVAGKQGVMRRIEHIAVMEVPDVIQWLKGKELLLTSLFSIKDEPRAMEQLVRQLQQKGSAALAVKTSRHIERIPDCILSEGDRLQFPIIQVAHEVSYLDIMTPLMHTIFTGPAEQQRDLEAFFRWLTELAMGGKGLHALLKAIENFTGNVVTVESDIPYFETADALTAIEPLTFGQKKQINAAKRSVRLERHWGQKQIPCLVTPLMLNEVVYGYVSYWHTKNEFREADFLILERAIPLMALEFLKVKTRVDVEQNYKDDLLLELLEGRIQDRPKLEEKATYFSWDLRQDFQVFLLQADGLAEGGDDPAESSLSAQELLRSALNKTRQFFSFDPKIVLGIVRGRIAVLYPMGNFISLADDKYPAQLRSLCEGLRSQLTRKCQRAFSVGIGNSFSELKGISEGYRQASAALQLGGVIYGGDFCCHFNELKIYRILTQFHDREELRTIYEETVGKLAAHDEEHQTNLTGTLRAFFDCHTSLGDTARQLFVHVNTIKYRLQKIEQMTGCRLHHSEERLWLQIGLKIQSILK